MDRIPTYFSNDYLVDYPTVDCENPMRVSSILGEIGDIAEFSDPEPCTGEDLLRCHSDRLIYSVTSHGEVFRVAKKAAGGALAAARQALSSPSFALIRPPGHHAGRDFNGGFCFFNNMAVALMKLLDEGVVGRALIVDIDLHYGNGTLDIVKDDRRIEFHNIDAFRRDEFFTNLEAALKDAAAFDIVGCSAGFDTYVHDWGGLLTTDDYHGIASMIAAANRRCFTILEGGYYIPDLGKNVKAYLRGLLAMCL